MQALVMRNHGGTEQLTLAEVPRPRPGAGEVLVEVRAAALNHLDLFVLAGLPGLRLEMPHIGGADGAGVIAEVGEGVNGWRVGDEVVFNPGLWCGQCEFCRRGEESLCVNYGILGEHCAGTFAEFVKVPAVSLARRPAHLSWPEAAAFPLTFLTAWRMLVTRARLAAGETVLIHGIGGGVALAALALAVRLGAEVIVTSGSEEKLQRAREMGAKATINYATQDVVREVKGLTGKRGVDVVVETAGAATWMASLRSAARGGRIVTCGATTGPNPAEEVRLVFWNQLSILGSTMGSVRDWEGVVRAIDEWALRPVVDSVLPLAQGRAAYERMAQGGQFGKIVLATAAGEVAA
ncbi:MAG: zinc-binding dehydrogenase [Acidobacteriota bacterium]|mgnify:CR=1 FL=1|jgi:NADPH:quinone reductase-like Zn-dependent oxidoreductase